MVKKRVLKTESNNSLTDLPICYGNFNKQSSYCLKCTAFKACSKIPPPKEPSWCNPP